MLGGQLRATTPNPKPSLPPPHLHLALYPHTLACLTLNPNLLPMQVIPQFHLSPLLSSLNPRPTRLPWLGLLAPKPSTRETVTDGSWPEWPRGRALCVLFTGPGAKYVLRKTCLNGIQMKQSKAGEHRQRDGESKGRETREQGTEMEVQQHNLGQGCRGTGMGREAEGRHGRGTGRWGTDTQKQRGTGN